MERKELLERIIMGLEQQIPDLTARLKYYEEDDLELKYSKKFLASMEENLKKSRAELSDLDRKGDSRE